MTHFACSYRFYSTVLLMLYPIIAHIAMTHGAAEIAVGLLGIITLLQPATFNNRFYFVGVLVLVSVFLGLMLSGQAMVVLYLPPILMNTSLFILFSQSLSVGNTPIITRYAELIRDDMPVEVIRYTRRVTQLWAVCFALLTLESILLAVFAPIDIWSLFNNILNYVFILTLFVAEYIFRYHFLSHLEHPTFYTFCRKLIQLRYTSNGYEPTCK